jgi:hypothetical protein
VPCMSELTHSHFGGFLLHRGWFRPSLATQTRALLSTGGNAVSPRQDIHCADHIGVVFVAAAYALETRLRWPILGCYPSRVDFDRRGIEPGITFGPHFQTQRADGVLTLDLHDSIHRNYSVYAGRATVITRQNMQKCANDSGVSLYHLQLAALLAQRAAAGSRPP